MYFSLVSTSRTVARVQARPRSVRDALRVEPFGDVQLRQVVGDKPAVDPVDHGDLFLRARLQDDAVGLQALVLAASQFAF